MVDSGNLVRATGAAAATGRNSRCGWRWCPSTRVLPKPEVMVADASNAFGPDGRLKDERYVRALAELMALLRAEAGR